MGAVEMTGMPILFQARHSPGESDQSLHRNHLPPPSQTSYLTIEPLRYDSGNGLCGRAGYSRDCPQALIPKGCHFKNDTASGPLFLRAELPLSNSDLVPAFQMLRDTRAYIYPVFYFSFLFLCFAISLSFDLNLLGEVCSWTRLDHLQ